MTGRAGIRPDRLRRLRGWRSRHWAGALAALALAVLFAAEGREILHVARTGLDEALTGARADRDACFDGGGAWDHHAGACVGLPAAAATGAAPQTGTD